MAENTRTGAQQISDEHPGGFHTACVMLHQQNMWVRNMRRQLEARMGTIQTCDVPWTLDFDKDQRVQIRCNNARLVTSREEDVAEVAAEVAEQIQ